MKLSRSAAWSLAAAAALALVACTSSGVATPAPDGSAAPGSEPPPEADDGTAIAAEPASGPRYRIVSLGDSYTLGTGTDAPRRDSWPSQLAAALSQRGGLRVALYNLAQESSPSVQVLEEQLREVEGLQPDVVTLQVGVNDIVSKDDGYAENVAAIFDELLLILPPERIFAITTPDHTLTQWGGAYGSHGAVEALNASLTQAAATRGITVIDIGPVNERVATDESLLVEVEPPKPYGTAKQYAGWAETIGPYLYDALASRGP